MDRLIVKNFGPLKDVDIELNKINLFIGENGSGKSVLGKIITIVLDFDDASEEDILQKFNEYNIGFITSCTIIEYHSDNKLYFQLKDKQITFNDKIEDVRSYSKQVLQNIKQFENFITIYPEKKIEKSVEEMINDLKVFQKKQDKLKSKYIPAERNLISLFNKYVTTFITADIPLPKFLLNFSSEYTRARENIKELKFLNVEYQLKNGQEHIFYEEDNSILLEESSSGIQSALPLYLTVKYFAQKHEVIVIEEPEQNLFPKAQKETVEYIVEQISDENSLFMMTHSPYILTALNNLILANDVKEQKGLEAIEGIVKEEQCVAFEKVSAYMLVDGKSINIMDEEDRLIGVNLIDAISDEVSSTFDTLLAKLD